MAISQIVLVPFTTIIDPPSLINIVVAILVTVIEGSSVGYVLHYLKRGCFT